MKVSTTKSNRYLYLLLAIMFTILLWQVVAMQVNKAILVPTPLATLGALVDIVRSKDFFIVLGSTLKRVIIGFLSTSILAIALGIISGILVFAEYLFKPLVTIFKSVPTMAMILLALIWFSSEHAPMFVGSLVCFPVIYQNVLKGIRAVNNDLIEMATVFNVKKQKILSEIYLPSIKPFVVSGLSTASGLYVKVVIAAEVLSQPRYAIGTSFQIAKSNLDTASVFAWAIIAIIIASSFDMVIKN